MVPFLRDPDLRTRRPLLFESFVETSDVEQQGGAPAGAARVPPTAAAGGGASASILAPPKDYEGIRLGPYKYIAWPSGEKELYDINKDPNELNNIVKDRNFFPVRNYLHTLLTGGVDETGGLEDCVGRFCREDGGEDPARPQGTAAPAQAGTGRRTPEKRRKGTGTETERKSAAAALAAAAT